ncbi:helix-turn-helix domain-containing protein [Helicobacter cinaedi]|nr:helix-turn-helix domain-containing protein [Helicobacter cinaedi]
MSELEKQLIAQTLTESHNDLQKASDMLGMNIEVLRHKIARYGL